jgi:transcriptional regulator with XRE-family HTH domain
MQTLAEEIGIRLRNYRKAAHLTQEKVAFRAGLHPTYIGQLERGEKNATIDSIDKIIRALNISFDALLKNLGPTINEPTKETALQCYNLIEVLPPSEQQIMFEIIERVIQYKKL